MGKHGKKHESDQSSDYYSVVKGKGKLALPNSRDLDKKRKKREKKKEKKRLREEEKKFIDSLKRLSPEEREQKEKEAKIKERRRFENNTLSGRKNRNISGSSNGQPSNLSENLTRIQLNQIHVHREREVDTLLKEASFTYAERQEKYNARAQKTTETNEMPPLVMTKIQ